tara:strand:- start:594 stop:1469 length:876 start_codon:yes stop_codon:yes gene_type:complete
VDSAIVRSTGETVRKAGERLWPDNIPIKAEHLEGIASAFNKIRGLYLPGGQSALSKIIDTEHGPLRMEVTNMYPIKQSFDTGGNILKDQLAYGMERSVFQNQNPHAIDFLHNAAGKVSGTGSVMIDWPNADDPYEAPASIRNLSSREQYRVTKDIRNRMRDVYHNQLIPDLQRVNPGQHILLANQPISASRERMYRGQGMGHADPLGVQYSIVGPERGAKAQPFEPFGGQLPDIYQDEIEARQGRRDQRANVNLSASIHNLPAFNRQQEENRRRTEDLRRRLGALGYNVRT